MIGTSLLMNPSGTSKIRSWGPALCGDIGEQICYDKGKADSAFLLLLYVRNVNRLDGLLYLLLYDPEEKILNS
jgi:hypothetical protein